MNPIDSAAVGGAGEPAPLNVIDPEADRCCVKRLNIFLRSNDRALSWVCSECGMQFRPEMTAAGMKLWRCVPFATVIRK
jgi:methionine synthase II (cobalamin-independent)